MLGYITLDDFDPETAWSFAQFKEYVFFRHGSFQRCFEVWDSERCGAITYAQFRRLCDELHFQGVTRRLFLYLDPDEDGTLAFDRIDKKAALDHQKHHIGDTGNIGRSP